MTPEEFNDKYDEYLEPGNYGLAIDQPEVTAFLDAIFQDLTKIRGFQYAQIKLKFGSGRFCANGISRAMCVLIEKKIEQIVED